MSFGAAGGEALDYRACRYDGARLDFRGPCRRVDGGHIAVLGGTESYGKFIPAPWPDLLEEQLGRPVANLALLNGGIDACLGDPGLLGICRSARVTIIELGGVANLNNRFYAVHPRRNDRFLRPSRQLADLCPGVDFTCHNFTRHLLQDLAVLAPEALPAVLAELQSVWMRRMEELIGAIGGTVVLLWLGDHPPARRGDSGSGARRRGPGLLVDAGMIARLRPKAAAVLEIAADAEELHAGYGEMVFSGGEALAALEMLGPAVHRRIARQLGELFSGIIGDTADPAALPPQGDLPG